MIGRDRGFNDRDVDPVLAFQEMPRSWATP
jgi:rubredoxin